MEGDAGSALAYVAEADSSYVVRGGGGAAPIFLIDHAESSYNLFGLPQDVASGKDDVAVDPDRPTVYAPYHTAFPPDPAPIAMSSIGSIFRKRRLSSFRSSLVPDAMSACW